MLSGALLPWRQSYEVNLRLSVMDGSFAQLWSLVKADFTIVQDSVQQRRRGRGHSKRLHAPSQRQRNELVARSGHTWAQTGALAAEHQHNPAAVVGGGVWHCRGALQSRGPRRRRAT